MATSRRPKVHPSPQALAVAALAAQKMPQIEIAQKLGLPNQSAVSRLFAEIDEDKWIKREFNWDAVPPEQYDEVKRMVASNPLETALARETPRDYRPPKVHPVYVPSPAELPRKFEAYAPRAAGRLAELLPDRPSNVGVAWGTTLWNVAQSLILPRGKSITFVPLCGDPIFFSPDYRDRTSSRLVSFLSRRVNEGPEAETQFWMGVVPAFVPPFPDSAAGINRLINLVPDYCKIFGPRQVEGAPPAGPDDHERIADNLDMILTSIGTAEHPLNFGRDNELLGLKKEQQELLHASIWGDVGGVLLARSDAPPDGLALVRDITRRWTGLNESHLRNCARRASDTRPGVVVFAFGGDDRADVVLEIVRRSLVSHLIIGSDLETAILRRLGG